jgi:hypothetical protein
MKGADRAYRGACWLIAMHAKPAHEFVILGENDRIFVFGLNCLRRNRVIVGEVVLLRTGALTLLAGDA